MHEQRVHAPPQRSLANACGAVLYHNGGDGFSCDYERGARLCAARHIAALKGVRFVGERSAGERGAGARRDAHGGGSGEYLIPDDTLTVAEARALGIRSEHDLFGGVVPHAFVATKAITQPLLDPDARAPPGWSHAFHVRAHEAVLRGFTAFSLADALHAGERLLQAVDGPVRIKQVRATGGRKQAVVHDGAALRRYLAQVDAAEVGEGGLLLEENLGDVATLSFGQLLVGDLHASYHGTQHTTTDRRGRDAYGGSTLTVVRGGFGALTALDLDDATAEALAQVRSYDARARESFPGLLLSRSNYDVAQGLDARGRRRSGVLEQSWRIGGATPAEVVALERLQGDPAVRWVRAACREVHGACTPPDDALVLFAGEDPAVGQITLYAWVEESG